MLCVKGKRLRVRDLRPPQTRLAGETHLHSSFQGTGVSNEIMWQLRALQGHVHQDGRAVPSGRF